MLLRSFHLRDRILQMKLFNSLVRPMLEYNSPVWFSHLTKDSAKIFSPRLTGLKNVPYSHRSTILN